MKEGDIYYRYEAWTNGNRLRLALRTYRVIRTTRRGGWIREEGSYRKERFMLDGTGKRVKRRAYPTKELAYHSFCARQKSRLDHAKRAMNLAETAQQLIDLPEDNRDGAFVMLPDKYYLTE